MKKWMQRLLVLLGIVCLWGCLSGFVSADGEDAPFLYEYGKWKGKTCGSYNGAAVTNGSGTLSFKYGGSYTGDFVNGRPSGQGTYTYANGKTVSGCFSWTKGTDYLMEGPTSGSKPHYEGTDMVYVGMLRDGEPCGFGTLDFEEGGTFYGEFKNGTVKGKGVYLYREPASAKKVTGSKWSFVSRSPSSLGGRWYTGLVCNKTWQGYGMLCYNYSYYIGEVKDNYCDGHGTYWQWAKQGDPSGKLTRKDYGHYECGNMTYACTHGCK